MRNGLTAVHTNDEYAIDVYLRLQVSQPNVMWRHDDSDTCIEDRLCSCGSLQILSEPGISS